MKTFIAAAAAAFVVCSFCVSSSASVQINDRVRLSRPSGYYGTSGGEFLAEVDNNDVDLLFNNGDFGTFCVEIGEHISLGSTYRVSNVGLVTMHTGSTLGSFAAWLYTEYLNGNISIVNNQDANAVQVGIWKSMGYLGNVIGGFNLNSSPIGTNWDTGLLSSLETSYSSAISGNAWTGGVLDNFGNIGSYTGQIQVMNLVTVAGANAQDQLFRNPVLPPPTGGSPLPEPMSFFVWSMLAMCVGSLGLRSRNS